jgi:hypothetical protein
MQDISSRSTTKPDNQEAAGAAERRERLRVLLLGTNLWVLCVLWPAWSARIERGIDIAFETLSLLPLALGALVDAAPSRHDARARFHRGIAPALRGGASSATAPALRGGAWQRPVLWLVVFPAAIGAALALRPEPVDQQLFGPLAMCVLALSLCAYVAAAASGMGRSDAPALRVSHQPLGAEPWDAPPPEHDLPRRLLIGVCFAGAVALGVIAPRLGGFEALEAAWGDAAPLGAMLSAVVGAALGITVLAVHLGQGLRAPAARERDPDADTALRTVWFLFLALLGAATYVIVQP